MPNIIYKEIDQLSKKDTIAGTEKIVISDTEYITPDQILAQTGGTNWGSIGGSLDDQTDLMTALESKQDNIDRSYDGQSPDGLGYLVLDKDSSFASQVNDSHTIYEIRYDYDLGGGSVTIPAGCTLYFVGGSISNGTVVLDGTRLDGDVKMYCSMSGTIKNHTLYSSWNNDVPLSVSNAKALGCAIYVDKSATLTAPLSFFGMREVTIRATITNSSTNYIEIGYSSSTSLPCSVDIWNATYVKMTGGKELIATIRNCDTLVLEADSTVSGKGSIAYCTFHLGTIYNFSIIGHNNGWINENTFIKGRFITTFTIQGDTYPHNHNVFYNPTFEGNLTISLNKCAYNTFRDCRLEDNPTITFGSTAANNRFYRSWLENNNSLWRMFYGSKAVSGNGVYFDDSTFVKAFTIDRNSYINGRDLSKVSLCDDNLSVRHETSSTYARLKITPKTDFGVIMNSDNNGMSRMTVAFYDTTGANIEDTLTSYLNSLGNFTKETSTYTYYSLSRDDYYAYLQVSVDKINAYLKTTYGVDENDNPVKQLGYVSVGFLPSNVRKVFNFVDFRVVFPANAKDNAGASLALTFASPNNVSDSMPTIKSTISGTTVPYSLLDGEECLNTTSGILYRRTGSTISAITKSGFNGSYSSIADAPDMSHYPKYVLCEDEAEYNAIQEKDSGTLYLIPES